MRLWKPDQFGRKRMDFALVDGLFIPADSKEIKYAKLDPPVIMTYEPVDNGYDCLAPEKDVILTLKHKGVPISEPIPTTVCVFREPESELERAVRRAISIGQEYENRFFK